MWAGRSPVLGVKFMPKAACDISGERFGRLVAISRSERKNTQGKRVFWKCQCECGKIVEANISDLRRGHTTSCGCFHREVVRSVGKSKATHGESNTILYRRWKGMKNRCYNQHDEFYYRYGGRGISVCDLWKKDYPAFRDWALKNGYDPKLSLDRIDNDGNYSPENCRWVNYKTQHLNRAFKRDERGIFVKV